MTSKPSCSVALACCQGARHLPGFLDSLTRQSLLPQELVACDDASTDGTLALLEAFAARSPFPVRIEPHGRRVGVVENFSWAIRLCSGSVIALADQDDVWRPDKLEKLMSVLDSPGVLAAFSDASVVDEALAPLGYTMWQRVRFTRREQERVRQGEAFSVLLKHHVVTGATLAFKTRLRDWALPVPNGWPHDAWLALVAAAHGGLAAVAEPLIAYRQHEDNLVGGRRKTWLQEAAAALALDRAAWYREQLALWRALKERLGGAAPASLDEKIAHIEARAGLPAARWRRLPGIMREILSGRYARHARNWGSVAIDMLVE